jgi:hypothetical protein
MLDLYEFFDKFRNTDRFIKGNPDKPRKDITFGKYGFEKQVIPIRKAVNDLWCGYINNIFTLEEFLLTYSIKYMFKSFSIVKLKVDDIKKIQKLFNKENQIKSKKLLDEFLKVSKFTYNDLTIIQENGENILYNLISSNTFEPNILQHCELLYKTKDKKLNKFKAVAILIKKLTKGEQNG